jgi:hypothetical protein
MGKFHFAGEHTSMEFLACAHNAYISGVKAAERVVGTYVKVLTEYVFLLLIISSAFR